MARIALYLEAFVRELHDELQGRGESPGAKQSLEPPSGVLQTSHYATDRERFNDLSQWFCDRLKPPLARAGLPTSGDLESDLRRLRQSLG